MGQPLVPLQPLEYYSDCCYDYELLQLLLLLLPDSRFVDLVCVVR